MKVSVGTSGFAFKEWKGPFYPRELSDDEMLSFYAGRFPTVEINNTFYRLPKESVLLGWASQVPDGFTFAIKASQRITHHARLKPQAAELVDYLLRTTSVLGAKLGPILFQLPPNLKKDLDRLQAFLALLPRDRRFTIEFRHPTWFDDEVVAALRAHDVALCVSEQQESVGETDASPGFQSPLLPTASWGYLRLHRFDYDTAALTEWAKRLAVQPWQAADVFFKHDHTAGSGPPAVDAFLAHTGSAATTAVSP
jgi:uncharacterized protein YecE (DUF72 family)